MTPLDLRLHAPRGVREKLLGVYLLPRTIDKLRAELPGGSLGAYLNEANGFSAYVIKRLGIEMDELRAVVAQSDDEANVVQWLQTRITPELAARINTKLETFVVERMSADDQRLVRERHPVMAQRPDLNAILDVLDADDMHAFGLSASPHG